MKAILDKRQGVKIVEQTYEVTLVSEATNIVGMLDGAVHTLAYFERADGSTLMVGGGRQHCIVTFTGGGQNLTLASDAEAKDDLIEICASGQYGEYPAEIVCSVDQANTAVTKFYEVNEAILKWI